jgi:hypothetical protein
MRTHFVTLNFCEKMSQSFPLSSVNFALDVYVPRDTVRVRVRVKAVRVRVRVYLEPASSQEEI